MRLSFHLHNLVLLLAMQLLESKIQEAKSKKETLKARAQSAKFVLALRCYYFQFLVLSLLGLAATLHVCFRTATKVSEMLGNVNTSSALSAFEKMEEKGKLRSIYPLTIFYCKTSFSLSLLHLITSFLTMMVIVLDLSTQQF